MIVTDVAFPTESVLYPTLRSAGFYDAHEARLRNPALSPADIFLRASRAAPNWVGRLMTVRNAIVRTIGLKDVGSMSNAPRDAGVDYAVGDRMGIFDVLATDERELLLGIDDKHLDVRVSVLKKLKNGTAHYTVSTVVYVKNWVGRLYMVPVGRIHPQVVRAMMCHADV